MLVIARIYEDEANARAAAAALVEAGYSSSDVALMEGPRSAVESTVVEHAAEAGADPEAVAAVSNAPNASDSVDTVNNAMRVGSMLGQHAGFYMERLTEGRTLVVATPPFIASRMVEVILDRHDPLPDSHTPAPEPFVPVSERATPFSDMLGLPVLSEGTFSEAMGFKTSQDGLSHFSRWFTPRAEKFSLSSLLGMKMQSEGATPLSSKVGMPVDSKRLDKTSASFGMPLLSNSETPFSSMLGLKLLSKRERFLTS